MSIKKSPFSALNGKLIIPPLNLWIIVPVIMTLFLFSSCPTTDDNHKVNVVMIGDSITYQADWNSLLKNVKVANLGISGDTTAGVLNRLGIVYILEPKIMFIMIGINDFRTDKTVEDIMISYREIATKVKDHNIKLVIQSVLYLGRNYYYIEKYLKTNYSIDSIWKYKSDWLEINRNIKIINERLEEMALEFDAEFINLNNELSINGVLSEKYEDEYGLHLNKLGCKKWAEIIKPIINKNLTNPTR